MCLYDDYTLANWANIKDLLLELEELTQPERGARIQAIQDDRLREEVHRFSRPLAGDWLETPLARWAS